MIKNINKLPSIVADFVKVMPYSMPLKIIIGFLFTALGGSSVLGLLSEFAVYNYALINGFRAPVEGIPYLRATVTAVSLLMIIVALVAFSLVYLILKQFALFMSFTLTTIRKALSYLSPALSKEFEQDEINSLTEKSLFIALFIAVSASLLVVFLLGYTVENFLPTILSLVGEENRPSIDFKSPLEKSVAFFSSFIIYISMFRPRYTKEIAFSIAGISVLIVLMIMFNASWYSKFLNITGFGGERNVTLYPSNTENTISGKLLIQSNDYYILLLAESEVIEFPVKLVKKITYKQSPIFRKNIDAISNEKNINTPN
ncbi:hypothetical protein ACET8V_13985 [Aeromonas veronii]